MDNFSSSFEVLRATPNLNSQDKKSASRGQGQTEPVHDAWEVSQSDLMAFPPLFEEESIDSRKARLISYLRGSAELKKKHKEFCITADTKAFGAIWMTFVAHQDPEKQRAPTSERGQGGQVGGTIAALDWCTIPTAILSTRSVGGEADNEGMYERLSKFLREKKAYVATLQSSDLSLGIGHSIQTILRQLLSSSGAGSSAMTEDKATTACHIEALYSFYEEETGISAFLSGDASTSLNKGGQTPTAATATKKPPPPSRPPPPADTETLPEAPAAARGSIVAARATSDREMRTRKATSESSGPHNGLSATAASSFPIRNSKPNDLWSSEKKKNLSRPIVVMIHGVERVDTGALRDLCQLLTQERERFPCCLILGASTSCDALLSSMPCDVLSKLHLHPFHLPSPTERLQSFFQDVLLSAESPLPLVLAGPPMDWILNRFTIDDGSLDCGVLSALEMALLDHRRSNPLSALSELLLVGSTILNLDTAEDDGPSNTNGNDDKARECRESMVTSVEMRGVKEAVAKSLDPEIIKKVVGVLRRTENASSSEQKSKASIPSTLPAAASAGPSSRRGKAKLSSSHEQEDLQLLSEALSEASNIWCEWRLGLLWAHSIVAKTGGGGDGTLTHLSLPVLYSQAAYEGFLPPPPSATSMTVPMQAPSTPLVIRDLATSPYPGHRIIWNLTGKGSPFSMRRLVDNKSESEDAADWAIFGDLCEELLPLAKESLKRNPTSSLVSDVLEKLKKLRDMLESGKEEEISQLTDPAAGGAAKPIPTDTVVVEEANLEANIPHLPLSIKAPFPPPPASYVPLRPVSKSIHTDRSKRMERTANLVKAPPLVAKAPSGRRPALGPATKPPPPATMQDRVADFLADALEKLLRRSPFSHPLASAFAYSRTDEMDSQLTYAPRSATHAALLKPHLFLGGAERDVGMGLDGAPLAYRLLLGQNSVDVGRWFQEFCDVSVAETKKGMKEAVKRDEEEKELEDEDLQEEEGEGGRGRKKKRGGRRLGRKRSPDADEGMGGKVTSKKKRSSKAAPAADQVEEMDEEQAVSCAVSFCQAVAELQFVGVCRGSKRRKAGMVVQRAYFPPETF